jgi:AraC family transcriptional regulator, regulatory protein of adaptative response / DNA-3-methyladenine glycosylase II
VRGGCYISSMRTDDETFYRALAARDRRFDGVFFVGVTTTGVYCRPICPARTPQRDRCRFFDHAAAAEQAGFRPCLRCRPELAPGHAPMDAPGRLARQAAARIEAGALNDGGSLETLADELGLSSRQLRRVMQQEFGVAPVVLAQTKRLLLAKHLLTETSLPMIAVASASGFASLRRFNALFRTHYGMPPSRIRRRQADAPVDAASLTLSLAYRSPFAWDALLGFLSGRATAGVEVVADGRYARTIAVGDARGWIRVEDRPKKNAVAVEMSGSLLPALAPLLGRIRCLFDLDCRPDRIAAQLAADPRLAAAVSRVPGLRVPGCIDGFELAVRTILGQRISVAAATTLAGRFASAFGEPIETPIAGLDRIQPRPERVAAVDPSEIQALGVAGPRAVAIRELAAAMADGSIRLEPGADPDVAVARLKRLPGVGDWTAQYIAMRALRWPDAFPTGDLGLLKAVGETSIRSLDAIAESWRPWRAYAAMHLWNSPLPLPLSGATAI